MKDIVKNGIFKNNPIFVQTLGMCPVLATSTSVENAFGMGIATTFVLLFSNIVISLIRKLVDKNIRIPVFIVVIATFVTLVEMILKVSFESLYSSLGIFIPLIVVNCLILGRAEAFASRNNIIKSIVDALAMGLGFTLALTLLGVVREVLGNGTIYNIQVMPESFSGIKIMVLAPGAFLALGLITAFTSFRRAK